MNGNWFNSFGGNRNQGFRGYGQELPAQTNPTQFASSQVSPTQQYFQRNISNTVVPHYHPSHLTTINQHHINHQHHFPHTQSVVNECFETNTMCGTPFRHNVCGCNKHRGW